MSKKIIIGVVVILALGAAAMLYLNNRNRTLSPPGQASVSSGDLSVSIAYSRPSMRGRMIFGAAEAGALQPYGKYWRLGANESTEITFNQDVQFNGQSLKKGTYRLYAIPGEQSFEIIVNTELGKWGAFEPDHSLDILKTTVPVEKIETPVEQYTVTLNPKDNGVDAVFEWADVRFTVPITNP